ncbi:MAG: SDR family NAD(P)-dependent oxidoreductase, partial [Zavarzinella sp.]|nr:SDR family NAD(P)-dependent oxidoreductase [Zavarzinella sp.]
DSAPSATVVRSVVRPVGIAAHTARRPIRFDESASIWLVADAAEFATGLAQQFEAAGGLVHQFAWTDTPPPGAPKSLAGLVLVAPDDAVPADMPLRAFRWLKRAAPSLAEAARGAGAFFATVSKLDGAFGFGSLEPTRDPVQGALAGLAKTASHEWPAVACKAVDVDPAALADLPRVVAEEILTAGPVEVGVSAPGRVRLEVAPSAPPQAGPVPPVGHGDVIVVTGGARGVTAEALLALARAVRPKLVLLGRTPVPATEPAWLSSLQDEARIKQAIATHIGRVVTPREVGEEYKRVLAQREIRNNLRRLREAGATVEYLPVDVQDAGAVSAGLADVRARLGPIAAVVHGAGVLADRRIEDLTEEQFQFVYSTKVIGLRNLLTATDRDPLKAIVLFSSSTGRFGRTGQVAYAAANEVLNKTAQRLSRSRPRCRTVAINWGPWDGGMVTPALAKVFESEGIGLIPLAEGGRILLQELSAPDRAAEVVVLAGQPHGPERTAAPAAIGPVFERTIALADHRVLRSHVIGERAVLPFVLHLEWLAHAALHGNPGLKFHGFDELRIFHGVHVEEAKPAAVRVLSGRAVRRDGLFFVPVELRGTRKGREVTFSRAEIVLADRLPEAPMTSGPPPAVGTPYSVDEVYEGVLFHGPELQGLERLDAMADAGAVAMARSAPAPAGWMENPVRGAWLADPLALDVAFQLLSTWSYRKHRAVSLPCFAGQYRQYRRSFPADGVTVAVRITRDTESTARADVEFSDADGRLVARMTDAEHVIDPSLNDAFRRGRLAGRAGARSHLTRTGGGLR